MGRARQVLPTASELATLRERDRKAVDLALTGLSYAEIADELGMANRSVAWKAVHRAIDRQEHESVADLRALENAKYDKTERRLWKILDAADKRDDDRASVAAFGQLLRLFERRARLNGLDLQAVPPAGLEPIPTDPEERVAVLISLRDKLAEKMAAGDDPDDAQPGD